MPPKLITIEWEEEEVFVAPPLPPVRLNLLYEDGTLYFDAHYTSRLDFCRLINPLNRPVSEGIDLFLE